MTMVVVVVVVVSCVCGAPTLLVLQDARHGSVEWNLASRLC